MIALSCFNTLSCILSLFNSNSPAPFFNLWGCSTSPHPVEKILNSKYCSCRPHRAVLQLLEVVELDSEVISSNPRLSCKVKRSCEVKLQMLVGK